MKRSPRVDNALFRIFYCLPLLLASCQKVETVTSVDSEGPRRGPQLKCTETVFRSKSKDGHVRHDFVVENTGTEPLIIKDVVSSCGCTVAHPSLKEIPPGGSATVGVDLHVQPNRRESSVFVRSTDAANPTVELKVAATDMPERMIQFVPAVLRLNASHGDISEVTAMLKIEQFNNSHRDFDFKDIQFKSSNGVIGVDPLPVSSLLQKPLIWNETPVKMSEKSVSTELLDRTVTLIPVRFRVRSTPDRTSREYTRADLGSLGSQTSAMVAFEVRSGF